MTMDFIDGEKFITIGDDYFCSDSDIYLSLKTTIRTDIKILYTHNQFIGDLFKYLKTYDNEIIIVSHNTDTNISEIDIPNCVKKMFIQNVNFVHPKIESIPIGLENGRWFNNTKNIKIINKNKEIKKNKNLAYMNFNIKTNRDSRNEAFNTLKNKSFIDTEMRSNGNDFDNYIDNIYNHKFVVCPEGNGTDTHRTWETLYLNTIPIEKRNINNSFYEDLPICFVDNWSDITEDFLNNEYERITNRYWNLDKLKMSYWIKKIKSDGKIY
jgi:hypothetical protein